MVAEIDQALAVTCSAQAGLGIEVPLLPESKGRQHFVVAEAHTDMGSHRHLNRRRSNGTSSEAVFEGVIALPATAHDPDPAALLIKQTPCNGAAVGETGRQQQRHRLDGR